MPLIHRRTLAVVAITVGLPLVIIGCEGDKANAASPPAKCTIGAVEANKSGNGWLGFGGVFSCKNHDPDTVKVTFQIMRSGRLWAIQHATSSPVQLTEKCSRGGRVVPFRGRLSISVRSVNGKPRFFTKTGHVFHWRCLPR